MTAANGEFGKLVVETTAAVNMMALVSPAALANPKMAPVKIPGSAAGSTVRKTVWVLLAPKAGRILSSCSVFEKVFHERY